MVAMGVPLPRDPGRVTSMLVLEEPQNLARKWYFSSQEIEECSPSRKDGVDAEKEAFLRKSYCSFVQKLGMQLKMPQVTIACAMMLCHRFYMRQSHAKNDWQTIATACVFLAGKIKDTPCFSRNVVISAYEMIYQWDPSASQKIRQKELYDRQKDLIVTAEKLLLATIAYDLNIELPYKPLMAAVKRLKIDSPLVKIAWNFVNDWLHTPLCLQYKPHYIAAGSLSLAAEFQKVKLPVENGNVWWSEFEISPKQLKEVNREMLRLLKQDQNKALLIESKSVTQATASAEVTINVSSPQPATSSRSRANSTSSNKTERDELSKSTEIGGQRSSRKDSLPSQSGDTGSRAIKEERAVKDQPRIEKTDQNQNHRYQNQNQNQNHKHRYQIVSSQAYSHREEVQVRRDFPRHTSHGPRSGSYEDNRIIRAEFDHNARIKTFSVYHTSSKINATQFGAAFRKRKGEWERHDYWDRERSRNWRSPKQRRYYY